MTWRPIETCPYRRTVAIGCWNGNYWLYRTVGHREDDWYIDVDWRLLETATHWHDLEEKPKEI